MSVVALTHEHPVTWIELCDPDRRNAMTTAMFDELADALATVGDDDRVAVVVLHGAGKAFCAGFDLHAAVETPDLLATFIHRLGELILAIRVLPQVVVTAVHGAAIAGGCAIASASDVVVVSRKSLLGYPVHRLGLSPAVTTSTLLQKLGAGDARTLLMGGALIDGATAWRRGLAHVLVETDESVLDVATATARSIADNGNHAMRVTKAWINQLDSSTDQQRVLGPALHSATRLDDAPARIAAFLAGR